MELIGFTEEERNIIFSHFPTEELEAKNNELSLVFLESKIDKRYHLQDFRGFEMALDILADNPAKPIMLVSTMYEYWFSFFDRTNSKYRYLISQPNVVFIHVSPLTDISSVDELVAYYQAHSGVKDDLAILAGEADRNNSLIGTLHHDGKYLIDADENDPRRVAWFKKAKPLFGQGRSFDELWKEVERKMNEERQVETSLAGKVFNDICVDVEGTLLKEDGSLNSEVIEIIERYEKDRPVTIWTGGDLKEIMPKLSEQRVTWKILPKAALRGAKVAIVVDNDDEEVFRKTYGVDFDTYIKV